MAEDQGPATVPLDYAARVKQYRARLGLTQVELSARLGVSFATVNRWENGQTKPAPLSWQQLLRMDESDAVANPVELTSTAPGLDFTGSPQAVRAPGRG